MPKAALTLAVLALAASVAAGSASASPTRTFTGNDAISPQISSNWAGYAILSPDEATPQVFTDVTGTWVQPKSTCSVGRISSSAFWVGIGGFDTNSQSLEQLGTGADCDGNTTTVSNYAWWELVPAASVRIPLKINAGDTIQAAVLVQGQKLTFSLKNITRRTRFSKVVNASQPLDTSSAEWIAEAPSDCSSLGRCNVVPLTNFGTMTFSKAAAIGNSHPGTLTDATWAATPIELIADNGRSGFFGQDDDPIPGVGAVPGSVSTDGRAFSVSWQQNLQPTQ
jgi:peptidase A4-like protein